MPHYPTLTSQMRKQKVTARQIAQAAGISERAVFYKLSKGSFTVEEAMQIKRTFFPAESMERLFEASE